MEFIKPLVGTTLIQTKLDCANDRVRAYATRKAGATLVLIINKTDKPAAIRTSLHRAHKQWLLMGPAIDAKQGVTLTESRANAMQKGLLHVAPYSAILLET
jgi:hypothetical protein